MPFGIGLEKRVKESCEILACPACYSHERPAPKKTSLNIYVVKMFPDNGRFIHKGTKAETLAKYPLLSLTPKKYKENIEYLKTTLSSSIHK